MPTTCRRGRRRAVIAAPPATGDEVSGRLRAPTPTGQDRPAGPEGHDRPRRAARQEAAHRREGPHRESRQERSDGAGRQERSDRPDGQDRSTGRRGQDGALRTPGPACVGVQCAHRRRAPRRSRNDVHAPPAPRRRRTRSGVERRRNGRARARRGEILTGHLCHSGDGEPQRCDLQPAGGAVGESPGATEQWRTVAPWHDGATLVGVVRRVDDGGRRGPLAAPRTEGYGRTPSCPAPGRRPPRLQADADEAEDVAEVQLCSCSSPSPPSQPS